MFDVSQVLFPGYISCTGSGTLFNVVIQARSKNIFTVQLFIARPYGKSFFQNVQRTIQIGGADVKRAEIFGTVLRRSPNNGNGREIGFRVYAKIRKGLVVFQQYVVVGHVLFYQRGFQNQCLYFVIGYDIFKGLDPDHQSGGFRIMGSREILLHSVFKYAGFSDIYDFSGSVFHQINARQFRQCFQFFPYVKHLR
jgi:hypothetical protein